MSKCDADLHPHIVEIQVKQRPIYQIRVPGWRQQGRYIGPVSPITYKLRLV